MVVLILIEHSSCGGEWVRTVCCVCQDLTACGGVIIVAVLVSSVSLKVTRVFVSATPDLPFEASSPSLPSVTPLSACVVLFFFFWCPSVGFSCINTGSVRLCTLYTVRG